MSRQLILLVLLLVSLVYQKPAQSRFIPGTVTESGSKLAIPGVTIIIEG